MDEATAIARLQQGDISGLEALVKRYQKKAIWTAYLITHDKALAEDVVQNAFLTFYQRSSQYDPARPFAPYFMRSVANAAIKALRPGKRQVSLESEITEGITFADALPDPSPGPADLSEQQELAGAVWGALSELSPEKRAVVVLRYYLGYSTQEIADETGTPTGTVKWRLSAARRQLGTLLSHLGQDWRNQEGGD
jgi:RNA polymerase sigma-70 factor (ECF subfamily)